MLRQISVFHILARMVILCNSFFNPSSPSGAPKLKEKIPSSLSSLSLIGQTLSLLSL
uniref:Uncharacterized protein n=1 Tax=Lepeophtheirus salmonis TaxID=72036 RepID=A0A0K2T9G4_LEPSM